MKRDALVIALIGVAHALSHFYQLALAPLFPMMSEELGISYSTLGVILMFFFAPSALLQPVAGFVVDRVGGRAVLAGGISLMVAGAVVMGAAAGVPLLAAGAFLMGVGNSVFHPADFSILNARVSQPRLGYAFSAHGISGALGFAVAPIFSAAVGLAYGWRAALFASAAVGVLILVALFATYGQLAPEAVVKKRAPVTHDVRALLTPAVLRCFAFFVIWGAAYAGISGFAVSAMQLQFGVGAAFAASTITAYMLGSAAGMVAGGYVAANVARHDLAAAAGLAVAAAAFLAVASGALPGSALVAALGIAGFAAGVTYPSRDLIVRASTPPGAAGRVYGFAYSGLDLGVVATPVAYGFLLDHGLPQAVFYVVFGFTALAILTVLRTAAPAAAIPRT